MVFARGTLTVMAMLALGVLMTTAPAMAAGGDAATFNITVVQASKAEGGVDPRLKDIGTYLQKAFTGYQSFKHLDAKQLEVKQGEGDRMALPGGKMLTVKYLGRAKGFVKVHLTVDGLKTTVNVKDGGLFFQAGRVLDGGIMVLAIGARTSAE